MLGAHAWFVLAQAAVDHGRRVARPARGHGSDLQAIDPSLRMLTSICVVSDRNLRAFGPMLHEQIARLDKALDSLKPGANR